MWKRLWVVGTVFALVGCTTFSHSIDRIRAGMDKDEVLSQLGNPKRTFRENSLDHWTYLYFQSNQEWRRDVVFENGKVIRVTRATPAAKSSWLLEIEGTTSVEEYEAAVRSHHRRSQDFKYIDGEP